MTFIPTSVRPLPVLPSTVNVKKNKTKKKTQLSWPLLQLSRFTAELTKFKGSLFTIAVCTAVQYVGHINPIIPYGAPHIVTVAASTPRFDF